MPPFPLMGETCVFLLLLHYRTYGFVASRLRGNSSSQFLSHPIRVLCLYNVLKSSLLVKIRHYYLWHLMMYFMLTYFYHCMSCLNVLQIFPLLLENRARIYAQSRKIIVSL